MISRAERHDDAITSQIGAYARINEEGFGER
jgi:hypothetical protein